MRPALRAIGDRLEEQVHEHGLAAPDSSMDVKAARRLGGFEPDQSGESARLRFRPVAFQLQRERVETVGELRLRRVILEVSVVNERAVAPGDAVHFDARPRSISAMATVS